MTDGLYGIGFGVANETNRSALNPASAIDPRDVRSALVQHPALFVSNYTLDIVKRNCIKFAPEIADRSIDETVLTTKAMLIPSTAPAITSVIQCAIKYTLETATAMAQKAANTWIAGRRQCKAIRVKNTKAVVV